MHVTLTAAVQREQTLAVYTQWSDLWLVLNACWWRASQKSIVSNLISNLEHFNCMSSF